MPCYRVPCFSPCAFAVSLRHRSTPNQPPHPRMPTSSCISKRPRSPRFSRTARTPAPSQSRQGSIIHVSITGTTQRRRQVWQLGQKLPTPTAPRTFLRPRPQPIQPHGIQQDVVAKVDTPHARGRLPLAEEHRAAVEENPRASKRCRVLERTMSTSRKAYRSGQAKPI